MCQIKHIGHFKLYFNIQCQLSLNNNILLKENQIIIKSTLTNKVLQIVHQQHQIAEILYKQL